MTTRKNRDITAVYIGSNSMGITTIQSRFPNHHRWLGLSHHQNWSMHPMVKRAPFMSTLFPQEYALIHAHSDAWQIQVEEKIPCLLVLQEIQPVIPSLHLCQQWIQQLDQLDPQWHIALWSANLVEESTPVAVSWQRMQPSETISTVPQQYLLNHEGAHQLLNPLTSYYAALPEFWTDLLQRRGLRVYVGNHNVQNIQPASANVAHDSKQGIIPFSPTPRVTFPHPPLMHTSSMPKPSTPRLTPMPRRQSFQQSSRHTMNPWKHRESGS